MLLCQKSSYCCTQIAPLIASHTDPKLAMFSLNERTNHQTSHYILVGRIVIIPVLKRGTQYLYGVDILILLILGCHWVICRCVYNFRLHCTTAL